MGNSCNFIGETIPCNTRKEEQIPREGPHHRHLDPCELELTQTLEPTFETYSIDKFAPLSSKARLSESKLGQFMHFTVPWEAPSLTGEGWTYIGELDQAGQKSGKGIFLWSDGSKYIGYWDNDKSNGRGRLLYSDGDVYEGDWVDNKAEGKGKYTHFHGATYEGD